MKELLLKLLEENTNLKEELTFQVLSYMKNIINEEEFAQAVVEIYNHYCAIQIKYDRSKIITT